MDDFEHIESAEAVGERKYPWPIDILLYPVSICGIVNIFVIVLGPVVVSFLPFGGLIRWIFALYACWYLSECVKESASGQTRAPIVIASSDDDLGGMFGSFVNIIACCFVCFAPSVAYRVIAERQDNLYWILLLSGTLIFPMLFLAVTLFDTSSAWNPFRLIISIIKTFPQYLALTGCLMAIIILFHNLPPALGGFFVSRIVKFVILYVFMIYAHLIGWLYYNNEKRLDWF
jgi:hypothetical protein